MSSTPCWVTAAAVWRLPIRRLPKCRPVRSSKRRLKCVKETGIEVVPEIMIPLVGEVKELEYVKNTVDETAKAVMA